MKAMTLRAEIGGDGVLRLELPCDLPPGPAEVVVIVQPEGGRVAGPPYQDLGGIWAGQVPADFDVEEALREIRGEWVKELDELV